MAAVTSHWTRVQTLFEHALDRPEDERSAWLRAQCGHDPALYREVEALLDGDRAHHPMFAGHAADLLAGDLSPGDDLADLLPSRVGERVGAWVLGDKLGEGGMGAVYRAERAEAESPGGFRQTAAVKLVKPGMDSAAVLARFRAERQILARLQHPGIARLLDGGLTEDGRPYFAMELVEGEPITDACDARALSVRARLGLFVRACEAVRYAHRSLVVHRDLKPSNLLVVEEGAHEGIEAGTHGSEAATLRPVLLDFGIARLLDAESDGSEVGGELTRTGHRVLTPAYAAPEQVRGEAPTTATDVYALGGILYRLLCGAAPIETKDRARHEVEAAILTEEPARPSERVTEAGALARSTSASALVRELRGDLDTICLKALRKEPEERYGSAGELLADVERYLGGLPIEARPTSGSYRVRKFVGRHRAGVLGTAVAVLAIVALSGFYTARLATERDRAETEAATAEQTAAFLQGLFEGASPDEGLGLDLTAADLLTRGAQSLTDDLADQPEVQAALQVVIGKVYQDLGAYDSARVHLERSLATRERLGDPVALAETQAALGALLRRTDETDRAIALHRSALDARRAALGPDDPATGTSYADLGAVLHDLSRYDEAEAAYRSALRVFRRDSVSEAYTSTLDNFAGLLVDQGKTDEALATYPRVLALKEELYGPVHSLVSNAYNGYAITLHDAGDLQGAEAAYRRSVRIDRQVLGENHPDYATSLNNLGILLYDQKDYREAERVFDQALAIKRAAHGDDHPQTATTRKSLAFLYSDLGRTREAEAAFTSALATFREAYGEDHIRTAEVLGGLARLYTKSGDHAHAEPLYRASVRSLSAILGDEHPYVAMYQVRQADALHHLGRAREAAALFDRGVRLARETLPDDNLNRPTIELLYGQYLADLGRCTAARPALEAARDGATALGDTEQAREATQALRACH